MSQLLDTNVLIALVYGGHDHHATAREWFRAKPSPFATSPITQGGLIRFLVRVGATTSEAVRQTERLTSRDDHEFWPDDLRYDAPLLSGVIGHRQVTDAYLAAQASARGGSVVTFDSGLAALRPDVVELVPT